MSSSRTGNRYLESLITYLRSLRVLNSGHWMPQFLFPQTLSPGQRMGLDRDKVIRPKFTLDLELICQHEMTWVMSCHGDSYAYTVRPQIFVSGKYKLPLACHSASWKRGL